MTFSNPLLVDINHTCSGSVVKQQPTREFVKSFRQRLGRSRMHHPIAASLHEAERRRLMKSGEDERRRTARPRRIEEGDPQRWIGIRAAAKARPRRADVNRAC